MQGMYAVGDGSTTFRVPDLRGQFLRSLDCGAGLDADRALGSKQGYASVQHQHEVPVTLGTIGAVINMDTWEYGAGNFKPRTANITEKSIQSRSNAAALSSNACKESGESRPTNIALIAQIKY